MSLYHYNGTDIVYVLQAKPEHSFSHARYCIAFSEFYQPDNADHRMINLSVAWLIMQSRLIATLLYSYVYDCILTTNY